MQNFFTWQYWLSFNPEPLNNIGFYFLDALILLFFAASLIFYIKKQKSSPYRGIMKRLYNLSFTNFILGIIFLFFNYENIPFFKARFWLALWILSFIIILVVILLKIKEVPEKKRLLDQEIEKKKYLP